MALLLGIDLGSTSIKAILYDLSGNAVAKSARPMRRFHPDAQHPEWTVWDPETLWADTAAACRETLAQIADAVDVKGVAVTGMGMDGLPVAGDGRWLYPLISWHDPRTQPQYEWWVEHITAERSYTVGGNPVWAINSALRMLWMKENEPAIFAETYKWLLIEDFLNHCLTGVFATDFSMASCTMLFDQRRLAWSDEMCEKSGIPREMLPDAFPSGTFLGRVTQQAAEKTGLKPGTLVFLGGHDHLCGALPVGVIAPGSVLCISGTWEAVDMVAHEPPLDVPLGRAGITVQANVAPGTHMVWGGNPAGEMLEWYRRSLGAGVKSGVAGSTAEEDVPVRLLAWDAMIALAREAQPGCGGVLFLPHLGGASCPVPDPRSRGAFTGLTTRTGQAEVVRSICEGLNFQLLDVIRTMESGTRRQAVELVMVGGAVRNRFWMQNKADMLGIPVRVPEVEEATVLGAAILAGCGAGLYENVEDAFQRVKRSSGVYAPDEKMTQFYEPLFAIYRDIYPALAGVHHRLFDRFSRE